MTDWIHNTELAIEKRKREAGMDMGLQKEWEKSEDTEEDIKIKETLFTDDLTRLYRFDSRKHPHLEIEIFESSDILKVRYVEKSNG